MPDPPLRLRHRDMLRALDEIDPLGVVAQQLVRRAHGTDRPRTGVVVAPDATTVEDRHTGRVCLLPTPSLHMIGMAALATLTVRELLTPAVVAAAVFGDGPAGRLHLSLITRHIPNFSCASTHPANLLVIAEVGWAGLDLGRPHPGMVIINATRRDLPEELLAEVDRVYVDDIGLLEHNQHRTFVRWHLAGSGGRPDSRHRPLDGRHRAVARWRYERRIDTDLGHVLTGGRGPTDADDVILVELFNGGSLAAWLAARLCQAAIALGIDHQ
jgi:hypothetical protein